jgi:8-oxo-dGTP diphosphatase
MAHGVPDRDSCVHAAGGLLWRLVDGEPRFAVIHRPKRGDWSLPKGKLEPGEWHSEAAQREVEEETQCRVRLVEFAGHASYVSRGQDKVVLYWHMAVEDARDFVPNAEVDALEWLSPREALLRLDHAHEREFLAAVDQSAETGGAGEVGRRAVAAAAS